MTAYVRVFKTENNAKAVEKALADAGFRNTTVILPSKVKGQEKAAVEKAIERGDFPDRTVLACTNALLAGQSLVAARAGFGRGGDVIGIMERSAGYVDTPLRRYVPSDPAPLSSAFGLPVLSHTRPSRSLPSSRWTVSSKLGMGMLSSKAAPLSSMFGLSTVTRPKRGRNSSMGLPLLTRNGSPLSSMFGIKTVTKRNRSWETSWGLPMLTRNPAPLSSLFGIKTLTRDQ